MISYMYDTYALLKAEGTQFPPVNENIDAILLETAAVSNKTYIMQNMKLIIIIGS